MTKKQVRLLTPGKLAGNLSVPAGTICSVYDRFDADDFYSNGRVTLEVVKDDILFRVFEDDVEYIDPKDTETSTPAITTSGP